MRGFGFGFGTEFPSGISVSIPRLTLLYAIDSISTATPAETIVARYHVPAIPDGESLDTAVLDVDGNGAFAAAIVGDEIHVTLVDPSKAVCPLVFQIGNYALQMGNYALRVN